MFMFYMKLIIVNWLCQIIEKRYLRTNSVQKLNQQQNLEYQIAITEMLNIYSHNVSGDRSQVHQINDKLPSRNLD